MTTSFNPDCGSLLVSARIIGPERTGSCRLVLDTGATTTMLDWDFLETIGYDPASAKKRISIITGSSVESAPPVTVDSIESLGHNVSNIEVLAHTLPSQSTVDGLLGVNFFRNTRLTIDFQEGIIELVT